MNNYDINGNEDKNKIYISDEVIKENIKKTLYPEDNPYSFSDPSEEVKLKKNKQIIVEEFFTWLFKQCFQNSIKFNTFFSKKK